ncbi:trypsin alpha-3-like [Condylostylus longicornis]|uniref:trypsin alpha-3-like n=1 Tax=Condylostylus longicornis TaxID=2530218 RepID=UPI00244E2F2C|nr:trypsin alpha-3-like [Condylostylus longicornis]
MWINPFYWPNASEFGSPAEFDFFGQDRIVGGSFQQISTRPFQVAIFPGDTLCGGSILNEFWMVTAAHCTDGLTKDDIEFAYGIQDISKITKYLPISRLEQHKSWNTKTKDSDISLIKAVDKIIFTPSVRPISIDLSIPPDGATVTASGYGDVEENGEASEALKSVDLVIQSFDTCNAKYGKTLTNNMICAIAPAGVVGDTCQGDSGGPLTYNGKLIGVVSAGAGCAGGVAGFYVKIANYIKWINDIIVQ